VRLRVLSRLGEGNRRTWIETFHGRRNSARSMSIRRTVSGIEFVTKRLDALEHCIRGKVASGQDPGLQGLARLAGQFHVQGTFDPGSRVSGVSSCCLVAVCEGGLRLAQAPEPGGLAAETL